MTVQARPEENLLQQRLEELYKGAGDDALADLRGKAWERFLALGLPTRRSEVFRYVPLRGLYSQEFSGAAEATVSPAEIEPYILTECRRSHIVFVNGRFMPALSNMQDAPKVVLLATEEAMRTYGGFLANSWGSWLKEEADPFVALNAALHPRGAFIYVPPKTVVEAPIQVLHVMAGESASIMLPRLSLFAGARSDLKLVSTCAPLQPAAAFYNSVFDLHLEEDVHVRCFQDIAGESADSWHFHAYRAHIKRNSVLKTVDVTAGSRTVRTDYRVALAGEGCEALLNNLWMLADRREAHSHVLMDHQAPNCHSMQLFKGALADSSRSSFEGKILVQQAAQKTDAFQLNNNLLLGQRAHADSKPNLEIFADDVKASHGATFGQLDEEHLFYMKSRGFSGGEAMNLLVYGYCKEILEMVDIPSLFGQLQRRAQSFLTKG